MKHYPAIDVAGADPDLIAAAVDEFGPTAIEERGGVTRVFFADPAARASALRVLSASYRAAPVEVPDEDWARRSQADLQPVTVGRLTVVPRPPDSRSRILDLQSPTPNPRSPLAIVIRPSMGFGTGHHATTRLCLGALQEIDVAEATVLDVGTGSGILAIAAVRLGAARALGIDVDPDAIQSARENLALNQPIDGVAFAVRDLASGALPPADVVTANLTGALLVRSASALCAAVRPGGILIVSGVLASEREEVRAALTSVSDTYTNGLTFWEAEEDGWTALAIRQP